MMPVQPVGGRLRPSKAVWETRCTGAPAWLDGLARFPRRWQDAQAVRRRA